MPVRYSSRCVCGNAIPVSPESTSPRAHKLFNRIKLNITKH
jgi:hypothetical protein